MRGIEKYLPPDCITETFAESYVLVSTSLTPQTYRAIVDGIPEPLKSQIIGFKQVMQLPEQRKAA